MFIFSAQKAWKMNCCKTNVNLILPPVCDVVINIYISVTCLCFLFLSFIKVFQSMKKCNIITPVAFLYRYKFKQISSMLFMCLFCVFVCVYASPYIMCTFRTIICIGVAVQLCAGINSNVSTPIRTLFHSFWWSWYLGSW